MIRCDICAVAAALSVPDAIHRDWWPEVYADDEVFVGPVCDNCVERHTLTEGGELTITTDDRLKARKAGLLALGRAAF